MDVGACSAQANRAVPPVSNPTQQYSYPPPPLSTTLLANNARMNANIQRRYEREDYFNDCMHRIGYYRVRTS